MVNLDGVVNNRITEHVVRNKASFELRDLWGDLSAQQVRYVADYEKDFMSGATAEIERELVPVYEFPSRSNAARLVKIYEREETR